ncbi:MAG: hypothetical protein HRU20_22630 [Pseudomonadales bacterium]|nr:hypothetical protein [Pseudomonadales bacterium]
MKKLLIIILMAQMVACSGFYQVKQGKTLEDAIRLAKEMRYVAFLLAIQVRVYGFIGIIYSVIWRVKV